MIDSRLRRLVAEQLGVGEEQLVDDTSLVEDLAADSLDLAELVLAIEAELRIAIPDALFEGVRTYGDLVDTISELLLARRPRARRGDETDLLLKARLLSPAGVTVLVSNMVVTPYAAEEIGTRALRAGQGARLELTVPETATQATLAAVRARFSRLVRRGVELEVRCDGPAGACTVPPHAA
jgi:acyl carrier protein